MKTTYIQEQAELTKIYASGNDERLRTEEQYNDQLLELKKSYLNKVIAAAGAGTKEAADAEKQLSDIQLQERKASVQKHWIEKRNYMHNKSTSFKKPMLTDMMKTSMTMKRFKKRWSNY